MFSKFAPWIRVGFCFVIVVSGLCGCGHPVDDSTPQPTAPEQAEQPAPSLFPSSGKNVPDGIETDEYRFAEVAEKARVSFTYRNAEEAGHFAILETVGGGVAMFDYDRSGRLDLCFPGGGKFSEDQTVSGLPTGLFRNNGNGTFDAVASRAFLEPPAFYTHGISVGDYNNNGFPDVLITGYEGLQLWENQGDGTFLEVHQQAGIQDFTWSTSAGWGDLTGDGNLDLYIASYVDWSFSNHPYCPGPTPAQRDVCSPRQFSPLPDVVYYNNGDGTFRNATDEAGLRPDGKGLGVLLADVNNNGRLDIYVANDTTDNFLYRNEGEGRLEEVGVLQGVAMDDRGMPDGSMGLDLCDFNQDGFADLWVTNFEREAFALYRNQGQGQFLHVSGRKGITVALGGQFVGWGTAFADFNRNGSQEVVMANGHVIYFPHVAPRRQLPVLLKYHEGRFERVSFPVDDYFSTPHEGRGLAVGDLNDNGQLDVVISHLNDPVAVLINQTTNQNAWLQLRLIGVSSNRDAIGTRLILHTSQGKQTRQITGGGSYLSHSDRHVFWGIPPEATVEGLTIYWPSGLVQTFHDLEVNRKICVVEGSSTITELPANQSELASM